MAQYEVTPADAPRFTSSFTHTPSRPQLSTDRRRRHYSGYHYAYTYTIRFAHKQTILTMRVLWSPWLSVFATSREVNGNCAPLPYPCKMISLRASQSA